MELHGTPWGVCGAAAYTDGEKLQQDHDRPDVPHRLQDAHQGDRDSPQCE